MQHFNKTGLTLSTLRFAALALFLGMASPMAAQDEAGAEEAAEVAATPKKKAKSAKKYPTFQVMGKVIDAATGEPLAGAQIQAYNNPNYTAMTDENGAFTINVPKFVTSIAVNLEGYNLNRTALNGRTMGVEVALYSDLFKGDYQPKTNPNSYIGTTDFEQSTAITIDEEMQNRLAGELRMIQRSANPGQGAAMFINGFNSLNSNAQPLIVLDGIIYDQMYDTEMLHSGYFNNLLQSINLEDIESVEVLQNGTAIYGAKAANGVILIKTKRCRSMATRIDVNVSAGVELRPRTMEMMDAETYRSYTSELLGSTGTKVTDFKFLNTDPSYYYYNMYHNNTNWKDEVYRKTAWTQNYGIAIQGGDDVAAYNLSVGFMDSKSTLKDNTLQRFNIRFNTDINFNNWFSTQFDASYTNVTRNLRDDGLNSDFNLSSLASTSFLGLAKAPFLAPYDFATNGQITSFISDADTYLDEILGTKASLANPTAILENGEAKNKNHTDCTMINIAIAPKWQPTKNFFLTDRFSYTMQSFDEAYYTPIKGMPSYRADGNEAMTHNSKYSLYSKHNAVFNDLRADWMILPNGAHRLHAYGGFRFMSDSYTASYLIGDNTGNDKTPNNSSTQQNKRTRGSDISWKSLAYYANIDYNYQEKYYLQGQVAAESSSRFGKETSAGVKLFGVPWGIFPSIQGAWVISNENWFQPNKGVNMLKLNVGFESVGNDGIDNSATLTYMSAAALLNNSATSIGLTNIGSSGLRWETTNRLNAGIEGNFLNNRLNVKFNYFYSKTNNLVALGTLAYVAGLTDYEFYTNDGALKNQGFNLAFNAKIVDRQNFKFDLGASVGHYKNKLTKLPEDKTSFTTDMYGATILSEVGRSAGVFYGYKTDGVYATSEAAVADGKYILDATNNPIYYKAGDMKFVDQDGNGEINEADRVVIGDPNPDIFGNINLNFTFWQRFSVSANFKYSLGNDVYNYQRSLLECGSMFLNQTTAVNRRWASEGQYTDIPRVSYGDEMGNSRFSDRWIEDGSYLKLKNVTLAYKFPIRNEYIQGLTIWAAANNLFTLTKYLGADPEVSCGNGVLMQGIDAGFLSSGRSFHLGVKINL
jgi:TonB-linked SusC/RagA family outer membrane protein